MRAHNGGLKLAKPGGGAGRAPVQAAEELGEIGVHRRPL